MALRMPDSQPVALFEGLRRSGGESPEPQQGCDERGGDHASAPSWRCRRSASASRSCSTRGCPPLSWRPGSSSCGRRSSRRRRRLEPSGRDEVADGLQREAQQGRGQHGGPEGHVPCPDLLTVALLGALVAVQTLGVGQQIVLDARVPALVVAVHSPWRFSKVCGDQAASPQSRNRAATSAAATTTTRNGARTMRSPAATIPHPAPMVRGAGAVAHRRPAHGGAPRRPRGGADARRRPADRARRAGARPWIHSPWRFSKVCGDQAASPQSRNRAATSAAATTIVLDARVPALVVAAGLLIVRAPFLVVVVAAALVAALLRLWGPPRGRRGAPP
jgi:hypothetical protein